MGAPVNRTGKPHAGMGEVCRLQDKSVSLKSKALSRFARSVPQLTPTSLPQASLPNGTARTTEICKLWSRLQRNLRFPKRKPILKRRPPLVQTSDAERKNIRFTADLKSGSQLLMLQGPHWPLVSLYTTESSVCLKLSWGWECGGETGHLARNSTQF